MSSQYIIAWSSRGLETILNLTDYSKQHMLNVLMEKPESKLTSNPVRDMIVYAVANNIKNYEIWQVESELLDVEIKSDFTSSPEIIKNEIAEVGELIFTTMR